MFYRGTRQGCPPSPLLFAIELSLLLSGKNLKRNLRAFYAKEPLISCHCTRRLASVCILTFYLTPCHLKNSKTIWPTVNFLHYYWAANIKKLLYWRSYCQSACLGPSRIFFLSDLITVMAMLSASSVSS